MKSQSTFLARINIALLAAALLFVPLIFSTFANLTFELPKVVLLRSLIILMGFIFFLDVLKFGKIGLPDLKNNRLFRYAGLGFIVIAVIASWSSIAPEISFFGSYHRLQGLFTVLHLVLLFFLILANPAFREKRIFLIGSAVTAGFLAGFYGILQKFGLDPLKDWNQEAFLGRVFSTLGHPNFLAQFLIITIFLNLIFLLAPWARKVKLTALVAVLIQILALGFTLSRAAFLGLLGGAIFLLIFYSSLKSRRFFHIAISTIVVGLLIAFAVNIFRNNSLVANNAFLKRIVVSGENLRSIESRLYIWPVALKVIKEHPFLGSGPETFSLTFTRFQPAQLLELENYTESADRAHNEVLDLTINYGILGMAAYYLMLLGLFGIGLKQAFRSDNVTEQVVIITSLAAIFSQIIANQFGFPMITHLTYLTFLIAVIIKSSVKTEKEIVLRQINSGGLGAAVIIVAAIFGGFIVYKYNLLALNADKAFKRAEFYFEMNDRERAVPEYQKAARLNPYQSFYQYFLANAALAADLELAEKAALKAKAISNSLDYNAYLFLGQIATEKALKDRALIAEVKAVFQNGLKLAPVNPRLHRNFALGLYKLGLFTDAVEAYQKLLKISPPYWQWKSEEMTEEQKNQARIFFKLNQDFKENFLYLARSYTKIGQYEKALEYLQYAAENVDSLSTYAVIYSLIGDLEKAKEYLMKALEIEPNNPVLLENLKKIGEN